MRLFAISRLLIPVAATLSAPALAAPDLITCEREVPATQRATLETPRGSASGAVCLDDGDSFSIGTSWVRLDGLDAPAMGRYCNRSTNLDTPRCKTGTIAMDALADLISSGIACKAIRTDHRNRWLAVCTLPDGRDLGEQLVRQGFACAATRYSARYVKPQSLGRSEMLGYWARGSGVDLAQQCAEEPDRRRRPPGR